MLENMLLEFEIVFALERAQWATWDREERAAVAKPSAKTSLAKSATVVDDLVSLFPPRPSLLPPPSFSLSALPLSLLPSCSKPRPLTE